MKIAVLGAGPAGSTFAYWVKKLHPSWEVDLYEMRKSPKSVCAGALGFHAINKIRKIIPGKIIRHAQESDIFSVKMVLEGKKKYSATINSYDYNLPAGIVVNRVQFDLLLLDLATDYDVNYFPETPATPINGKTVLVGKPGERREMKYDLVVDARGSEGYHELWDSKIHVLEQYFVGENIDPSMIYIFFNFDVIKLGYLWIIPGHGYDKIGYGEIVSEYSKNSEKYREYVMSKIENREIEFKEGATLPLEGKVKLVDKGVFKIGTSAGLVNPFTGAGIYYAIESAYNLAKSITDNKYITYLKYRGREIVHINEIRVSKYLRKKLSNEKAMLKALKAINGVRIKPEKLYRLVIKYLPKIIF